MLHKFVSACGDDPFIIALVVLLSPIIVPVWLLGKIVIWASRWTLIKEHKL